MLEIILPDESPSTSRTRLARAGLAVGGDPVPPIPALDVASAHRVVLIPAPVFTGATWPRLRIELVRAARFFVVESSGQGTAGVVAAMRDGAFDVVAADESDDRWREAFLAAAESQVLWLELYAGRLDVEGARLVGRSAAMQELRRHMERLGPTDVTVLVMGESGVGKERVAAGLHEAGRGGPLVTLNCAAMPRELIEAELFGAEKGAFTGAVRSRPGLVEQAQGGTLFLDEVGELDLGVQPKLLRFLETRRARRVGGEAEYSVRVRVVAATNRDLEREVQHGRFRADLYYRLAEVVIRIPPLRARADDIPDLARTFMGMANERFGKNVETIEPELVLRLQRYPWPGNIRELKGAIDRLVLFHDGPVLRSGWWDPPLLPPEEVERMVTREGAPPAAEPVPAARHPAVQVPTSSAGGAFPSRKERLRMARQLLEEGHLSLGEIAARVGVHPTTLYRWRITGKAGTDGEPAGDPAAAPPVEPGPVPPA